jgi:hypothetical protein
MRYRPKNDMRANYSVDGMKSALLHFLHYHTHSYQYQIFYHSFHRGELFQFEAAQDRDQNFDISPHKKCIITRSSNGISSI